MPRPDSVRLPGRRTARGEVDLYGLSLTTTPTAAELFREAQGRLLRVQVGAEQPLRAALTEDPTFALGHAVLALLGHDFGVATDVADHLGEAMASAGVATERERAFAAAVVARVRGGDDRHAPLLDHLRRHPRDSLALTVAVPTIAFSGAVDVPEQAWALVEGAGREFGSDWWYSGLLAFVRQEQGRFAEAGQLAERALGTEPAAGHAAHALAHVRYETNRHQEGLAWLDGWIRGPSTGAAHRAHYSWHAALHELALGDGDAVRRRYASELSPPGVRGIRALVDSASLLWRAQLAGLWEGALPIDEVLAAVDADLLVRPPTGFAAMHAAIALTAAQDVVGLTLLGRNAALDRRPVFRDVVAPLVAALAALVRNRPDDAADMLLGLLPQVHRLGGSDAQRDVVEATLLHALTGSGRLEAARSLIQRQLDRPVTHAGPIREEPAP